MEFDIFSETMEAWRSRPSSRANNEGRQTNNHGLAVPFKDELYKVSWIYFITLQDGKLISDLEYYILRQGSTQTI